MPTANKKVQTESAPPTEEPKSAHATPVVEKYVEKRKHKAEEQIEEEQHTPDED